MLLTGQPLEGVAPPAGEVEERQCAAACQAAPGCNVFYFCPEPAGCPTADSSAERLPYRHCLLRQQPAALPGSAQPIKASLKGQDVSVTSGGRLALPRLRGRGNMPLRGAGGRGVGAPVLLPCGGGLPWRPPCCSSPAVCSKPAQRCTRPRCCARPLSPCLPAGQLLAQAPTADLPGYELTLGMGFVNM